MNQQTTKQVKITSSDRLGFTLFIALMLHALVVLGISFKHSKSSNDQSPPSLDIILAQTKSTLTPDQYDFLAQHDQQGGGENSDKARPGAPVSANSPIDQQGFSSKNQDETKQNTQQQHNKKVLTQQESSHSNTSTANQKESNSNTQDTRTQPQLRIAKLRAEIKKMRTEYAKRPKQITLTASTKKAIEASYLSEWVRRIERIGNLNYPQNARKNNINGALRLNVTINKQGNVLKIKVSKSSGNSILDAAAKRIVKLAEPFKPFSKELLKSADQIVIIRTWEFSSQQQRLKTSG